MKHLVLLAAIGVSLGCGGGVMAQNHKLPPVVKLTKRKVPRVTPTPFQGKLPKATPTPIGKGNPLGPRLGERFNLRVWAVMLAQMPSRAWSGTFKIDDQLRWHIPQSQATNHQRGPGQTLEISEDAANRQRGAFVYSTFYSNPRKVKLWFDLYSVNNGQSSLRAAYRDQLDLLRESGKTYKCRMGKGEVALYVKVGRTGYIYGPLIQRPFPTPSPTPSFRRPRFRRP